MAQSNLTPRTYKVTFFDREMDVESVTTYHNVTRQGDLLRMIATRILVLDLLDRVKVVEENGSNFTKAVNNLLPYELDEVAQ